MAFIECVGAGGGAETPTLLWTNPNPTSAFAATTLNIDFSGYEYLIIEVVSSIISTANPFEKEFIVQLESGKDGFTIGIPYQKNNNANDSFRYAYINNQHTTIAFTIGCSTYQWQTSDNICVPLSIYGLKNRPI